MKINLHSFEAVLVISFVVFDASVSGQLTPDGTTWKKWCGKNYEKGAPVEDPGGKFLPPKKSAVQCAPGLQPYIDSQRVHVVVDLSDSKPTQVKIIDGETQNELASGQINSTGLLGPIKLGPARTKPYKLRCEASGEHQDFELSVLPRTSHSVVQLDATNGLLRVMDLQGVSKPFFPFGFYASYGGYLNTPKLVSIVQDIRERNINTIHPVLEAPLEINQAELQIVTSALAQAGVFFQYDMRHTYQNETSLPAQIPDIMTLSNLLTWYTADEPDGAGHPKTAPEAASQYIKSVDPYHPVALVLNCDDYFFTEYTRGTDIILADPYTIGLKSTSFAEKWGQKCSCDPPVGDCGCDCCIGNFKDISVRMKKYREPRAALGRSRTMQLWGVPQAFEDSSYWTRRPTGPELLLSFALYVVEGAVGITGWLEDSSTTSAEKEATKTFGSALEQMMEYLSAPGSHLHEPIGQHQNTIRLRSWPNHSTRSSLLIYTNLAPTSQSWSFAFTEQAPMKIKTLLRSNQVGAVDDQGNGVVSGKLDGLGCGAVIVSWIY